MLLMEAQQMPLAYSGTFDFSFIAYAYAIPGPIGVSSHDASRRILFRIP
jgi:hypothetical protein